jgi:hypothetical protein
VAALLLCLAGPAEATHVSDETVDDVAAQLR